MRACPRAFQCIRSAFMGPTASARHPFLDRGLQDLAVGVAGQGLQHDVDAHGHLEAGQVLGNVTEKSAADIYYAPHNLAHRQDIIDTRCHDCTITCFLELALAKDALHYLRFLLKGTP